MTAHLSPGELAKRVGVPVATVYRWNAEGTGPRFMKVGRHVRYRLVDVEAWEESRLVDVSPPRPPQKPGRAAGVRLRAAS